ncbi:SCO family protein [Nocardioides sp. Bht2]|uniref:SCO family protein n=1 Tax=Nocardioides sp. Bht2 TaxID=3392297 RepID=UPI0039B5AF8C
MAERRLRTRLVGAVLALGLLASACSSTEPDGEISAVDITETPYQVPPVSLMATTGGDYSLTEDSTKPFTLVFFGYVNCPDICKMVMSNIASALTRVDDKVREKVDVVFVTTDPARDTTQALSGYLNRFDPSFIGLTGKIEPLRAAAEGFHVAWQKGKKLPGGGYDVTHGTQIFLVDGDDQVPYFWKQDTSAAVLAEDLTLLVKES